MSNNPTSRAACAILAAALLHPAATALRAQDNAGAETIIRAESRLVLVDALAMDKKGKFVRDLTAKDFRLWEDNKEQKITSFSLESSGISPERPTRHYIVMFFDTSAAGQAGQLALRQQATRFVDGFASPDRYMAVITYSFDTGLRIPQNFTADGDRLKKALGIIQSTAAGTPTTTVTTPGRGRGAPATTTTTTDPGVARDLLASLRSLANSLANIRGRKALVLFSAGGEMSSESSTEAELAIRALNKANVAVYAVGSGSASTTDMTISAPSTSARTGARAAAGTDLNASNQSLGRALAEGTGGITFVGANELAESLGKVAQEQDEYYLLGYTPTVEAAEGTCHELRVKVNRSNLEVRGREGYCTSKPVDLLSGKPVGRDLEAKAAGAAAGSITAKMQLPWFYSEPNVARVSLVMEITPSGMRFQKEKGKLHGEFNLAGVALKPDGTVAARLSDTVKLDFDTQLQADAFLREPYRYSNQFEIAPGQYNFRMAFSSGEQGFGKVEMPLSIGPWNGQTLAVSGLALSRETHPAADLASGLDASLLEGQRPLVAKAIEAVPTANTVFQTGEPAYVYFEAYEPLLSAGKPDSPLPVVGVREQVLDRATGQSKVDTGVRTVGSFMRPGNPVIPIIASLPGGDLPAGAYRLQVTVMRPTGDPLVGTADFDVR